jgi:hypothetical protein
VLLALTIIQYGTHSNRHGTTALIKVFWKRMLLLKIQIKVDTCDQDDGDASAGLRNFVIQDSCVW